MYRLRVISKLGERYQSTCHNDRTINIAVSYNKKGQLSLTNPRDVCETIARFMFDRSYIPLSIKFMAISRNVFEIFDVKKYSDIEIRVTGH